MKVCFNNIHACAEATLERRQTRNVAGVVLHCVQCTVCGKHTCYKVKRDGSNPPELDQELVRRGEEARRRHSEEQAQAQQQAEEAQRALWKSEYGVYLLTPEWAAIRERVKQRDKICQGCLAAPIEQVHHRTYEHVQNEFAFELIGLCRKCHARWHGEVA